jgi:polyhydroxybutyrate depolymerase
MKTKLSPLAAALVLCTLATGFGQPIITTQPQSRTNVLGTTASFTVTATGSEPLAYQWQKLLTEWSDLPDFTNASLVLTNVQTIDAADYRVAVTNVYGASTSTPAHLYVILPALLQFSASSYTVAESVGTTTVAVRRTGDIDIEVSVDYATADGTATNEFKYAGVSGTLSFKPGETNQTILIPILNEGFVELRKYFRVVLSNPSVGAVLGPWANDIVYITDNDIGLDFQFPTYAVAEDAGAASIGVVRGDDGNLPVTLRFATADSDAKSGVDYIGTTNDLMFAPQERLKIVSIPILNNTLKQPNRSFRATLSNSSGATLGTQTATTITIIDNDLGFEFSSANYNITEDAGAALIGVLRGTDEINSTVTVDYATFDGSATNGVDYTGVTNTIVFRPGQRVQQVAVPILNNRDKQASRSFRLALSNPSGRAVLGSLATTSVSILDNDPGVGFERPIYTTVWAQGADFTVTVVRGNDWALGPITVDYATANSSALAAQDYQAVSGTLAFRANETAKTINIPILRSRPIPGPKTFRVILRNPTGGATLGSASSTTVNILGCYATVAPPFDAVLNLAQQGSLNVLTWIGGGELQRADSPAGPWQRLTNAASPFTVQSPIPKTFYRVTRPRRVSLYIPSSYNGQSKLPLVILLHGYSGTGSEYENWLQIQPLAEAKGFLYCHPDGTTDRSGNQFWNATDAALDQWNTGVDDAGYLRALIEEIASRFAVNRKQVYLIGHSNGGFMCYRMACQSADLIAGIASWAGATFLDPNRCKPSEPVNVLEIHCTGDANAPYAGGAETPAVGAPCYMPAFPGALQTVLTWAGYNGSSGPVADSAPSLDLTPDEAGLDTVVTRYTNCPPGGAVELWTIIGGSHNMNLSAQFSPLVIDWLLAHTKP